MCKYTLTLVVFIALFSINSNAGDSRAYYHYMMGDKYYFEENFEDAIAEYVKATVYDNESSQIRLKIANCYIQAENLEAATINVKKSIELDTENIEAKMLYAEIMIIQKKYKKALELCSDVLQIDPEYQKAIHCKATMLIGLNRGTEAAALLNAYLLKNPDDETIYYGLALVYETSSNTLKAEKYYKKALEINPNYAPAVMDLARIYEERDSTEQLINDLEALAQLSPLKIIKDKIILNCFDLASKNKNDKNTAKYYAKALGYLNIIEAESPELSNVKIQKALLLEDMERPLEAMKTLEDAVVQFPNNERLLYYLATEYDKNNRKDDALNIMENIIKLNPDNPEALNYVGYIYISKKIKAEKAKEFISRALAILPDDPYVMDSMGWVYFSTGDYKNAVIQLEKALDVIKSKKDFEPEIIEHLMSAYKQAGLSDKIKQTYSDLVNSGIYKEKNTELKALFEKFNEIPERSPASIDIKK